VSTTSQPHVLVENVLTA